MQVRLHKQLKSSHEKQLFRELDVGSIIPPHPPSSPPSYRRQKAHQLLNCSFSQPHLTGQRAAWEVPATQSASGTAVRQGPSCTGLRGSGLQASCTANTARNEIPLKLLILLKGLVRERRRRFLKGSFGLSVHMFTFQQSSDLPQMPHLSYLSNSKAKSQPAGW